MADRTASRVLLVYPRFGADSFWNYQAACQVVGARYSAAPLGLITVAALLPRDWPVRLIDRNVDELRDADLDWADLVMTGGMLPQQRDTLRIVSQAHARGRPVVVGGPDVTASPSRYAQADFQVVGEAEEVMAEFLRAWSSGARRGRFVARDFPDITRSPVPRFELLNLRRYMHVGVQHSRGCPFHCEFCNVVELNGHVPRLKTAEQMLAELDALHALGYRGHVDFVDDNFIGDRRRIKAFLPQLIAWMKRRRHPFTFSTEASLNLADDDELMDLLRDAGFFAIFVGIETPDAATLVQTRKRQNTNRDIGESIRRIYRRGIFVNAGFIVGLDGETGRVAEPMIACIEETGVPVCMVGLLYALPGTALSRRLAAEGRLHADSDTLASDADLDQCTSGLNFIPLRPRAEILADYRAVLRAIYSTEAYFGRVRRVARALDLHGHRLRRPLRQTLRDLRSFARLIWSSGVRDREVRGAFWRTVFDCVRHNPRALHYLASQAILYLHLKPYTGRLDTRLAEQLAEAHLQAVLEPVPAGEVVADPVSAVLGNDRGPRFERERLSDASVV